MFPSILIYFFLNSIDEIVKNIIMSFNHMKTIGPNSVSTKIIKLFINYVSLQVTEPFFFSYYYYFFSIKQLHG